MTILRPLSLIAAALAASAALAAPAAAQPRQGVVHPPDQARTPLRALGAQVYAANCVSCHGTDGLGVTPGAPQRAAGGIEGAGPPLRGVGALAPDFYLRTGYMPLGSVDEQPERSRVQFSEREIRAVVAYIASLGGGPPVPDPHPERGNVAEGLRLFTEHCAGCHQVVAEGGVVTGARVPPLDRASPVQIAQAVRIGPYVMPTFSKRAISDAQLDSIIRYVQYAKRPDDRGGWGIGHIGPVPEGMVTWLIGAVVLVGVCLGLGRRLAA